MYWDEVDKIRVILMYLNIAEGLANWEALWLSLGGLGNQRQCLGKLQRLAFRGNINLAASIIPLCAPLFVQL